MQIQQIELNLLQLQSCRHKKSCRLGSTASGERIWKKRGEVKSFRKSTIEHRLSWRRWYQRCGASPGWARAAQKLLTGHFPHNSADTGALCTFWRSLSEQALKKACVLSLSQDVRQAQHTLDKPRESGTENGGAAKSTRDPKKARASLI